MSNASCQILNAQFKFLGYRQCSQSLENVLTCTCLLMSSTIILIAGYFKYPVFDGKPEYRSNETH